MTKSLIISIPIILVLVLLIFVADDTADFTIYNGPNPTAHYGFEETIADIPDPGPNLLLNPGFETYTTSPGAPNNWVIGAGAASQYERETVLVDSGLNALEIIKGASSTPSIQQHFVGTLENNIAYEFRAKLLYANDTNTALPRINVNDNTAPIYTIQSQVNSYPVGEQRSYQSTGIGFISHEPTHTYTMNVMSGGINGLSNYFDTTSLTKTLRVDDSIGNADGALSAYNKLNVLEKPGIIGNSFLFDENDTVSINGKLLGGIKNTNLLTACSWVKPTNFNDSVFFQFPQFKTLANIILQKNGAYFLYLFEDFATGNMFPAAGFTGLTPSSISATNFNNIPLNEWSFFCATWDGSFQRLYWNGELINEQAATGTMSTTGVNALVIGGDNTSFGYYHGYIDEVSIWNNTALSDTNIYNMYHEIIPLPVIPFDYAAVATLAAMLILSLGIFFIFVDTLNKKED